MDAVEIVVPITIVETSGYVGPDRFEAIVASQLAVVFGGNLISGQTAIQTEENSSCDSVFRVLYTGYHALGTMVQLPHRSRYP